MTRVQLNIDAAPGVRLYIDREQEEFMVVLGRFVVELRNNTISVGEYEQVRWQEKPLLRIVTSG